jgi:hypothetical protein
MKIKEFYARYINDGVITAETRLFSASCVRDMCDSNGDIELEDALLAVNNWNSITGHWTSHTMQYWIDITY